MPAGAVPAVSFPPDLPISECAGEVAALIASHPVVVVAGETGSGKSTQLPKICLARGHEVDGMVAHTQPRRIAAREVASRVAAEIGCRLGDTVGYKVRFGERTSAATRIKVLTDGMLLAELERDHHLSAYHTIIVDEAHERSVNIDFILGYLKQLLPRRPELRVVVTSATIDTERFASYFDNCPVVEVSGRTWAVETRYRPADEGDDDEALLRAIESAVRELWGCGPGDVLVFLPGEREIREAAGYLERRLDDAELLPLFARLSPADQKRIFRPSNGRRVVLSTNVAETSLTVPGVHYVIDSGLARVNRFSTSRKVQQLPVERVSQAAADQRRGRCGRVRDGVCIRLYGEDDYLSRPRFTDPEIRRTSLATVVLRMKALRLGDIAHFPFIEPPDARQVRSGVRLLHEIGALDERERLTAVGRDLARLPVEPRIGRLLVEGARRGCLEEMLVVAARLSVSDPRVYPQDQLEKARRHHREVPEAASDIEAAIALFESYRTEAALRSRRALDRWCESLFLAPARMREWNDLYVQLRLLMRDNHQDPNAGPAPIEEVAVAFLCGFLGHIATLDDKGQWRGASNTLVHIHPSSRSFRRKPKWLVAAELVDTGKLYARQVLPVRPDWIERAAGRQIRVSYSDSWWDEASGNVMAFRRGTLFGITIYSRRRAHLGPVDPVASRAVFIAEALAPARMNRDFAFARHNRELLDEAAAVARKLRRPEPEPDDLGLVAFFDGVLPADVCSRATLSRWLKDDAGRESRLRIPRDLVVSNQAAAHAVDYPERVLSGATPLRLAYRYDPGGDDDGVTVDVPLPLVNQFDVDAFARRIPGWFARRVEALLRTLPKGRRRALQPLHARADELAAAVSPMDGDSLANLAAEITRRYGLDVDISEFDPARVPEHLKLRIELVDAGGREIDAGRDFAALKQRYGQEARAAFEVGGAAGYPRRGMTTWDFGDVPQSAPVAGFDTAVTAFPALVDRGDHVDLELFDDPDVAARQHALGCVRLARLACRRSLKELLRTSGMQKVAVRYAGMYPAASLLDRYQDVVIESAFGFASHPPRHQDRFERRLRDGLEALRSEALRLAPLVAQAVDIAGAVRLRLGEVSDAGFRALISSRLDSLIGPPFPCGHPPSWIPHLPRFIRALATRVDKFLFSPQSESAQRKRLAGYADREPPPVPLDAARRAALDRYRFMLEEYQVSLFAQELGTSEPVSAKRLDRQWAEVAG